MRVTVTVPDEVGAAAAQLAAEEGVSVSALYAEAVVSHVRERRRGRAFTAIDRLLAHPPPTVGPATAELLEALRREDAHRLG